MKKHHLFVAIAVLLTALVASCTNTHVFEDGYYFQAMGEEAEIVVTVDTQKARAARPSILGVDDSLLTSLLDKSTRVSVSLSKDEYSEDDPYPADISSMNISGAVEGDYSKFMINTGLGFSKEFSKVKEDGVKFYTDKENSIEVASPTSGVILFTNDSYPELYKKQGNQHKCREGCPYRGKRDGPLCKESEDDDTARFRDPAYRNRSDERCGDVCGREGRGVLSQCGHYHEERQSRKDP